MIAEGDALVTGAGRGLGRALALELARRGFRVHATMRRPETAGTLRDEAEELAGDLLVSELDVTRPRSITLPEGLRVLVNNAGIDLDYLPVEHTPSAQWREMFETNVFGLVEVVRRAIPKLRANGGGVVCNVTSISTRMEVPFFATYRASKAAVGALSDSLRAELAPFGIRVLEVMPGPVSTEMLGHSDRLPEAAAHAGYETLARSLHAGRQAVGTRSATPEAAARDIVDAILDDDAPSRVACDPLSAATLAAG